ncbi:unnamed protein product [Arctogadus glacialis]
MGSSSLASRQDGAGGTRRSASPDITVWFLPSRSPSTPTPPPRHAVPWPHQRSQSLQSVTNPPPLPIKVPYVGPRLHRSKLWGPELLQDSCGGRHPTTPPIQPFGLRPLTGGGDRRTSREGRWLKQAGHQREGETMTIIEMTGRKRRRMKP